MPESYPLPAYACSVWVAGDDLMVAFPGQGPEGRGHTIRLPASETGLKIAVKILKDRAAADNLRIGHDGTPTQYTVEQHAGRAWGTVARRQREEREAKATLDSEEQARYRAAKERRLAKERNEASAFIKELGL